MTRGKYGVRAANRLATLDSELLAEAQAKIADLEAAGRDLATQLKDARRQTRAAITAEAEALAREQLGAVTDQLVVERAAHAAERARMANEVFDLFSTKDFDARTTMAGWGKLAAIFGQGHRIGELVARTTAKPLNRNGRRANRAHVNMLSKMAGEK